MTASRGCIRVKNVAAPADPEATAIDWGEPRGGRYSLRDVIDITGVPSSSIHHYRRSGLLPEPERTAPNRFVYDERHLAALTIVRALRARGRTLDDIRDALAVFGCGADGSPEDLDHTIERYDLGLADRSTRTRLVDAAIEAFARQGYREVSVEALCTQADVAKGTFYRHFTSKDALFHTAAAAVVERAIGGFAVDLATTGDPDHAAVFARHLRHGLPVLLELAKRSIQDSGETAHRAADLFLELAARLGAVVGDDTDPGQTGGFIIMLAVVEIFADLVRAQFPDRV